MEKTGIKFPGDFQKTIAIIEQEAIENYHKKELFRKIGLSGLLLMIAGVLLILKGPVLIGIGIVAASITLIFFSFKQWQNYHIDMCMALHFAETMRDKNMPVTDES